MDTRPLLRIFTLWFSTPYLWKLSRAGSLSFSCYALPAVFVREIGAVVTDYFRFAALDEIFERPGEFTVEQMCDVCRLYKEAFVRGMAAIEAEGGNLDTFLETRTVGLFCNDMLKGVKELVKGGYKREKPPTSAIHHPSNYYHACLDASPFDKWWEAYKAGVPINDILAD